MNKKKCEFIQIILTDIMLNGRLTPTILLLIPLSRQSMVGAEGLPVGVQVVGLPWRDETCLRIMKELETGLKQ